MNEKYHQLSDMMKTEERENIRKILDVLLNYQKLRRDTSPENLVFVPKLTAEALGIVIKDALELGLPMEQCRTMLLMGSDTYINGPYEDYNVLTQALHQFVCEASERGVDKYYCLYILEISQIASSIDSFDRRTNIVGDVVCEAMRRGVNRTKCTSILRLSGFHVTPETFERDALVPFVRDAIAAKIDSNLLVQLIRVTHYDMAKVFELEDKYKSDSEDKKFNAVLLQLETAARKLGKLKHDQTLYDLESSTVNSIASQALRDRVNVVIPILFLRLHRYKFRPEDDIDTFEMEPYVPLFEQVQHKKYSSQIFAEYLCKLTKCKSNAIKTLGLENCQLVDISDSKLRDLLELGLESGSCTLKECRELVKSRGIPLVDDLIRESVHRALELKESQREHAHNILRLARMSSLVHTGLSVCRHALGENTDWKSAERASPNVLPSPSTNVLGVKKMTNKIVKKRKRSSSIANLILVNTTPTSPDNNVEVHSSNMIQYLWSVFTYYSMWRCHRDDPDRMTIKSSLKFYHDCFQSMSNVLNQIQDSSTDFVHPWTKNTAKTKKKRRERHEVPEMICEAMSARHAEILIHVTSRRVRIENSETKSVRTSRGGVGSTQNLMFDGFLRLIAALAEPCRSNVPFCNQCTVRNATERSFEIVQSLLCRGKDSNKENKDLMSRRLERFRHFVNKIVVPGTSRYVTVPLNLQYLLERQVENPRKQSVKRMVRDVIRNAIGKDLSTAFDNAFRAFRTFTESHSLCIQTGGYDLNRVSDRVHNTYKVRIKTKSDDAYDRGRMYWPQFKSLVCDYMRVAEILSIADVVETYLDSATNRTERDRENVWISVRSLSLCDFYEAILRLALKTSTRPISELSSVDQTWNLNMIRLVFESFLGYLRLTMGIEALPFKGTSRNAFHRRRETLPKHKRDALTRLSKASGDRLMVFEKRNRDGVVVEVSSSLLS